MVAKYFLCLFQHNGVINSDGSVDLSHFYEYVNLLVVKYGDFPPRYKKIVRDTVSKCDLTFDDNIERNTIKLVKGIRAVFVGSYFVAGSKDYLDVIME